MLPPSPIHPSLQKSPAWQPQSVLPASQGTDSADLLSSCQTCLEALFVQRLRLRPVPVPGTLAQARGMLRGSLVQMSTQRLCGAGFSSLTVAQIADQQGRPCSWTVVGLPQPEAGLPILGMDLIALQDRLSLVALDLAPTDRQSWEADCAPILARLHQQTQSVLIPRKRPDFAVDTFSSLAVIAGLRSGGEDALLGALVDFLQQTSDLWLSNQTKGPPVRRSQLDTGPQIRRWLLAEQRNRKEHNALAMIFGAEFAAHYLHDFLFSVPKEESGTSRHIHTEP